MARILVTGANGFVGRHLVAALCARGDAVVALDLAFSGEEAAEGVTRIAGSVTDRAVLERAVAGVDAVLHAAAIADLDAPEGAHDRVNRGGTEAVLAATARTGARVVLVSSYTTLIGRDTAAGAIVDPATALPPEALLGPYPAAKRHAEIAVERAAAAGRDALSVLPTAPVGPGDHRPTPPGRMILDLARGATPALVDTRLDLVDVRALARGILAALEHGRAGRRYVLAGESLALADLAGRVAALVAPHGGPAAPRARVPMAVALGAARAEALIARLTGRRPTAPLTGVRLAARPVDFATAATERDLGWQRPPLDPALAAALDWYRAEGRLG